RVPDYDLALYTNKKMKTTPETALPALQATLPVLEAQDLWDNAALYDSLVALAAQLGVKNGLLLWPLRVALSGKPSTPGGATELAALLGKDETLARVRAALEKLAG